MHENCIYRKELVKQIIISKSVFTRYLILPKHEIKNNLDYISKFRNTYQFPHQISIYMNIYNISRSTSTQDFHSPLFCNFHIALSDITKNHSKKQSLSGNVCGHMCTHHHMSKEIYAIKQDFVFKGKGLTLNILFFFILAIISLFYPSYFSIFSIDSFFPSHRLYRVKY